MSCYCEDTPKPRGHILKDDCQNRRNWFRKYHASYFTPDDPICVFFNADSISGFFVEEIISNKYDLRIYLAVYSATGQYVPNGYGNKLTVIFAPATGDKDTGDYFIPDPQKPQNLIKLADNSVKQEWTVVNYYPILQEMQKDPTLAVPMGNTNSIYYGNDLITDFCKEINCQKATGINLYFSSYRDKNSEVLANPDGSKTDERCLKRIIVQFVMTRKNSTGGEDDLYIEKDPCFASRPPYRQRHPVLDTGTPCPPLHCQ